MRHFNFSWAKLYVILILFSLVGALAAEAKQKSQWISPKNSKIRKMYDQKPQRTFVGKTASLIIDAATGRVLHQHNADEIRYPASLTKMMTLYLVFEGLENGKITLRDMIPVSKNAAGKCPMKLGLKAGDRIRMDDAIRGLCIKSANDAATAIAEAISGSEREFGIKMTQKAKKLGMHKTVFKNPSGLPDPEQVSTARDIATLSHALYRDFPQYCSFFAEKSFQFRGVTYRNSNKLLHTMPHMDGIKTGYTPNAGHNLATSVRKNGRRIIAVLLGAESRMARDGYMKKMLDVALSKIGQIKEELSHIIHPPVKPSHMLASLKKPVDPLSSKEAETMEELLEEILKVQDIELEADDDVEVDEEELAMTLATVQHATPKVEVPTAPRPAAKPKAVETPAVRPPAKPGRPKFTAKEEPSRVYKWAVQVGAFPSKKSAAENAQKIHKKHENVLKELQWIVSSERAKGKLHHKARFAAPDQAEAQKIAAALKKAGQDSFVVELSESS